MKIKEIQHGRTFETVRVKIEFSLRVENFNSNRL